MVNLREERIFSFRGVKKNLQTSVTEKSFIKDWITLTDLDSVQILLEERSNKGSSQQLKSPPKIR